VVKKRLALTLGEPDFESLHQKKELLYYFSSCPPNPHRYSLIDKIPRKHLQLTAEAVPGK